AKRFGISSFVIGATIVAFGTSLPEMFLHVIAAIQEHNALALGNIIGSNIANILLIIGVGTFFSTITMRKNIILFELPFALIPPIMILFTAYFFGVMSFGI